MDGTGDFAGVKGAIKFKDDVVNLKFDYRGHISLATAAGQVAATAAQDSAKALEDVGPDRSGGC